MPPRRYSTELRNEQTAVTRHRILHAGATLFVSRGYLGTTLAQIAETAGVSVQTVYNVVGGKAVLLKAVYDTVLAGDDEPVPISQRPLLIAMLHADDPRTALGYYAQMAREMAERIWPLLDAVLAQAASGDPALTEFADKIENERAVGAAATAHHLTQRFALRPDVNETDAADLIWVLTAPELSRLARRRNWDWDKYQTWLAGTLADTLLGPVPTSPAGSGSPTGTP